jgi:hypothetical protein
VRVTLTSALTPLWLKTLIRQTPKALPPISSTLQLSHENHILGMVGYLYNVVKMYISKQNKNTTTAPEQMHCQEYIQSRAHHCGAPSRRSQFLASILTPYTHLHPAAGSSSTMASTPVRYVLIVLAVIVRPLPHISSDTRLTRLMRIPDRTSLHLERLE